MASKSDKKPEGSFLAFGLAIGIPIGTAIGIALGNIGIGPAFGVTIGMLFGAVWEKKAKSEGRIRKLTAKEKRIKERNLKFVLLLGVVAFLALVLMYFVR